jgi:hypothetical protein
MADLCSRRPADHRTSWSASRRRSAAITIISCRLLSGSHTTEIVIAGVRGWHLDEVYLKIDASAAWLLKMPAHAKNMATPARRSSGLPVGSQRC